MGWGEQYAPAFEEQGYDTVKFVVDAVDGELDALLAEMKTPHRKREAGTRDSLLYCVAMGVSMGGTVP